MGIGLIAGLLLGLLAAALSEHNNPALAAVLIGIQPVGIIFKNLLSMVAIPLVATALFAGLAKLGELRALGRLVVRTLVFFWATSVLAITLGFAIGSVMLPEAAVSPERQAVLQAAAADPAAIQSATSGLPTGLQFIVQLVPANPFKAAADGNLLPVIVFVTIFAIATATLPIERRTPLINLADAATDALIRIVQWVLVIAPIGIFALVAPTAIQYGWEVVRAMLWFIGAVVIGVLVFIAVVYLPSVALIARVSPLRFLRAAFPSMFMGFSATTSLAALPNMIDAADKDLLIPRPVSGFCFAARGEHQSRRQRAVSGDRGPVHRPLVRHSVWRRAHAAGGHRGVSGVPDRRRGALGRRNQSVPRIPGNRTADRRSQHSDGTGPHLRYVSHDDERHRSFDHGGGRVRTPRKMSWPRRRVYKSGAS